MDAEENVEWLGAVIAQLKHDNDDLQVIVDPGTLPIEVVERKITIEEFAT